MLDLILDETVLGVNQVKTGGRLTYRFCGQTLGMDTHMQYISHRVNTVAQLAETPVTNGVELDLRDRGDRLILQHDPFSDGEDFSEYLTQYRHGTMILNIKSERIEYKILDELQTSGKVADYFFLDCSYPMIRSLINLGERHIAVRFSEFEPIEGVMALAGCVDWVWIDCFTRFPVTPEIYARLKPHFKLCLVSPELQGHPLTQIEEFSKYLDKFPMDAVCTKFYKLWQK